MTVREWIENGGYERMKAALTRYEINRDGDFDEDIFHSTLTKMLMKEKYADTTQQGYNNYCFKAYKTNVMRELQYPRRSRTTYVDDITPYQSVEDDGDVWWVYDAVEREFGKDGLNRLLNGIHDDDIINWLKMNV